MLSTPTSPIVHNLSPSSSIPQSILERLSPGNVFAAQQQHQQQQSGRRRSKHSLSGTIKQGKNRNLPLADLWSLAENTSGGAILLKAQLLEAAKKLQQKEVRFSLTIELSKWNLIFLSGV